MFVQFVADNVDHNVRTLDGLDTFHGMGIIATVTPGSFNRRAIPRMTVTAENISDIGRIRMLFYNSPPVSKLDMVFLPLEAHFGEDPTSLTDILWETVWLLRPMRPSWSGMMQAVHRGEYPGKSSVVFLPMIDMNSSDMSCIYSTLTFVSQQAQRYGITAILTFDQPLWWKATMIVSREQQASDLHRIVLRLGGLHILMSFLGCIGHLMTESGLQDVIEVVYASNAVGHILTGKAIARAIRAHFLVDTAVHALLVSKEFGVTLPSDTPEHRNMDNEISAEHFTETDDRDMQEVCIMFDELTNDCVSLDFIQSSDSLHKVKQRMQAVKEGLMNQRTAKLWLQYLDMVHIIQRFVKGERTGNWELHLKSMFDMLPYFAASGHHLYTKSVWLYLQCMNGLQELHPEVHEMFQKGYHVVRRSDRYWGGLSSDLVIEQVLMRSMKTNGGLTRGTGMSETQRLVWLMSMPMCIDMSNAMQELTGVENQTSEQHKDTTHARLQRDTDDTKKILEFLTDRNPFEGDEVLRNIANGVTATTTVNVDEAKECGLKILNLMTGKRVDEFSFKKQSQAVTMGCKVSAKEDEGTAAVDPILLFQRLVTAARGSDFNLAHLLQYELCSYPSTLFDSPCLLKQANKPALPTTIWNMTNADDSHVPETDVQFVLDGGSLLHRLPWPRGVTYDHLCEMYCSYVKEHFGIATVVFDGYTEQGTPSTKDMTHLRRTGGITGTTVKFDGKMVIQTKKDLFLSNSGNKQNFIHLLTSHLQKIGCRTFQAEGDADLLIVKTAVALAGLAPICVIGEDTDILVLLCHHATFTDYGIFFHSEARGTKDVKLWNIQKVKECLGESLCHNLLFVHALLGCDTTSRLHGMGKGQALKKFTTSSEFRKCAKVFDQSPGDATKSQIIEAGEMALLSLYNAMPGDTLNTLRYRKFCDKVATNASYVHPQSLPPSSGAAKYHSLRVYYQVQEWKGTTSLKLEEWGWKLKDSKAIPQQTDLPPAPTDLLSVVRCSSKSSMCNSKKCSCKKHGLHCSSLCGECRGVSCLNCQEPDILEE